jgi:hypothetical protein
MAMAAAALCRDDFLGHNREAAERVRVKSCADRDIRRIAAAGDQGWPVFIPLR